MTARRNSQFLKSLREHELLEPVQVAELEQTPLAESDDLQALGKLIHQKGWLTRFQINLVAQGRANDLILGPYRLIDRLGEGGMGQVFKAHHRPMNRNVALKVIRKEKLANPQSVQRFFREIQAAAKLVHPNIVLAFDAGQVDKTYYFAMEYVEGIDLAKLVKQNGPLPEKAACDCIRQAALGLTHAHEQGMIHRDIKPHNLLVTRVSDTSSSRSSVGPAGKAGARDVVKILDMGLARLQNGSPSDHSITQEGAVVGTPDYIAPEQALDARKVDGRSDLYSLGGVFFFLLTGRPPFAGGTLAELLLKHQMETPPDVRQLRPEVSAEVAALVARLLAKRPEDRIQSPVELAEALAPSAQGGGSSFSLSREAEPNAFSDLGGGSVDSPSTATLAQPRLAVRSVGRAPSSVPLPRDKRLIAALAGAAALLIALIVFLAIPKGQGEANPVANARTDGSTPPSAVAEPPVVADFTLGLVGPVTIKGGESRMLQIKVDRKGLGGKPIQVRLEGLPPGVSGDRAIIDGARDTAQVRLQAQANAGDVQKDVQVVASSGATEVRTDFQLAVQREGVGLAPQPPPGKESFTNSIGMHFVKVPRGTFWMGGGGGKPGMRQIIIDKDYYLSAFEVTQEQWQAVMGTNPSYFSRTGGGKGQVITIADAELARFPVENVSWDDCQEFVKRLNAKEGAAGEWLYRLPTEAEWEYACRAGATLPEECGFHYYLDQPTNSLDLTRANFLDSKLGRPVPVGSYPANRLGIYDLHGNVWEWCNDGASSRRVLRGGSWNGNAVLCQAAYRNPHPQADRPNDVGVRLARVPSGLVPPSDPPVNPPPLPRPVAGSEIWNVQATALLSKLSVSPDGKQALTCSGSHLLVWDLDAGKMVRGFKAPGKDAFTVAALPDPRRALVGLDGDFGLFDLTTGTVLQHFKGDMVLTPLSLAATPDGSRVATGSGSFDGQDCCARVFDVATQQQRAKSEAQTREVRKVAVSADGRRVLLVTHNKLGVWDVDKGPAVRKLTPFSSGFNDVDLSADGRRALVVSSGSVFFWDVDADKQVLDIGKFPVVERVKISPDGRLGLLARPNERDGKLLPGEHVLQLVDLATGKTLRILEGHTKNIRGVAFLGDGTRAVSVDNDRTMRAWDLKAVR